jgi:type III secretion protein C
VRSSKIFVSRGDGVSLLLNALAAQMQLPVIVSGKAQKKRVDGSFDLGSPQQVLERLGRDMGLIWYSDGQTLYVYDSSETRNAVGHMQHASVAVLRDFLQRARLADDRFAIRGDDVVGTFYVAGPPVYIDVVLNAARYLDALYRGADARAEHVQVIHLRNSFVGGRRYGQRDWQTTLPGMAETLMRMLGDAGVEGVVLRQPEFPSEEDVVSEGVEVIRQERGPDTAISTSRRSESQPRQPTVIVPYPETNSLLVRGTLAEIQKVKQLVAELDLPRRQIELSVWIIDIQKSHFDSLGVRWSGSIGISGRLGIGINEASATLDGERFLASVSALSERGHAAIVSRPVVLTQENVLAHFDSSSTFYTRLEGERTVSLESVTFGTLVSVLPRVSTDDEVEMQLKIEDGTNAGSVVGGLPVVAKTTIDTVARVPHSLSLLVGGYTRQEQTRSRADLPGLRRIPWLGGAFRHRDGHGQQLVRVFLIQPRVLTALDTDGMPVSDDATDVDRRSPLPEFYQQLRDEVREALDGA